MVSVLALAISVGGVVTQRNELDTQRHALDTQRRALDETKREFADAGAKWDASGVLTIYQTDTQKWTNVQTGKNADFSSSSAPNEPYAVLDVTNSGRTKGAIKATALVTSDTTEAEISPQCDAKGNLDDCNLPKAVDVGQTIRLYVPLKTEVTELTCNKYVGSHGIRISIIDSSPNQTVVDTGAGLAISTFCSNLPQAPH